MTDRYALTIVAHPIDRALTALSEAIVLALTGDKPSRFAEAGRLTALASQLVGLRSASSVDEVAAIDNRNVLNPNIPMAPQMRFNDGADLNRELIMLLQSAATHFGAQTKIGGRQGEAAELTVLVDLRAKLAVDGRVPDEIQRRIGYLLKRIGEDPHEPRSDPVVPPESIRGCPLDSAGQRDGDRMGEPLADREGGALDVVGQV